MGELFSKNDVYSRTDFRAERNSPVLIDNTISDIDSNGSEITIDSLDQRLEHIIEQKEYVHWKSSEAEERNRISIDKYNEKKRTVNRASLMTQRDILTRYRTYFDQDSVNRMYSELDSNKTEIYNEPYFASELAHENGTFRVVGLRDVRDGKICICDCENMDTLIHTSSHETMHDLSYQNSDQNVSHARTEDGNTVTVSKSTNYSGIFKIETTRRIYSDGTEISDRREMNRYLNEGITEMYTIESMQARGEYPRFDSYTQEVAWVLQLREKIGAEVFARAYFSGDVEQMESKVNSMSTVDNAWKILNDNINAYHQSITWYHPRGNLQLKKGVDDMIDDLAEGREYARRRL